VPRHDATTWKLPKGYEGLVGNSNIEIEVRQSSRPSKGSVHARKKKSDLLGHLLISRGGLEWRPRGGQIRRMKWERFAEEMEQRPIRRRRSD
jgi:hypothetical protein